MAAVAALADGGIDMVLMGASQEWLAKRLSAALAPDADQCHGAVKTISLLAELVQAGSKGAPSSSHRIRIHQ